MRCDGCHRMSFQTGGVYASPTSGEFNMCNCTGVPVRPDRSVRGCPTASGTLTHTPAQTRSQSHERRRDRASGRPAGSTGADPEADRPPGYQPGAPGPGDRRTGRPRGHERARERPAAPPAGPSIPRRPGESEAFPVGPARAQKRSRWTRRSPARSKRRTRYTGMTPVGAGVRRVELCMGGLRLGDPAAARW